MGSPRIGAFTLHTYLHVDALMHEGNVVYVLYRYLRSTCQFYGLPNHSHIEIMLEKGSVCYQKSHAERDKPEFVVIFPQILYLVIHSYGPVCHDNMKN